MYVVSLCTTVLQHSSDISLLSCRQSECHSSDDVYWRGGGRSMQTTLFQRLYSLIYDEKSLTEHSEVVRPSFMPSIVACFGRPPTR